MNKTKIILAHPGTKFSYKAAEALNEYGLLHKYITSIYYKSDLFLLKFLNKVLTAEEKKRLINRKSEKLNNNDVMLKFSILYIFLLLIKKLDTKKNIYYYLKQKYNDIFSLSVAKIAIREKVDAVYFFDGSALKGFKYLNKKSPNMIKILDYLHPPGNYLFEVYNKYSSTFGQFKSTFPKNGYINKKEAGDYFLNESKHADIHVAASNFTKNAIKYNGIQDNMIVVVPYGVDISKYKYNYDLGNEINVLFVGLVNQRKGIGQILEAAQILHESGDFIFHIVGAGAEINLPLFRKYDKFVNFYGRVSSDKLKELYEKSNIFLFPTLGEGFGLVILEAMASGLPVISTNNCAGNMVINNMNNGFVINPGSTHEIVDRLKWVNLNRNKLIEMSKNARSCAEDFSWNKHNKLLADSLIKKIKEIRKIRNEH